MTENGIFCPDLITIAERYMLAVGRLGEDSGFNRLTYFEAPISRMPTEEMQREAQSRWVELNDAGKALTSATEAAKQIPALAQPEQQPVGYAAYHPIYGWRPDLAAKKEQVATAVVMRTIESAAQQGWTIQPLYAAQPPAAPVEAEELTADCTKLLPGGTLDDSTFSKIEDALDSIDAPMLDHDGRYMTLIERIKALPVYRSSADTGQLKEALELADECEREFGYSRDRMVRAAKMLRALAQPQPPSKTEGQS